MIDSILLDGKVGKVREAHWPTLEVDVEILPSDMAKLACPEKIGEHVTGTIDVSEREYKQGSIIKQEILLNN